MHSFARVPQVDGEGDEPVLRQLPRVVVMVQLEPLRRARVLDLAGELLLGSGNIAVEAEHRRGGALRGDTVGNQKEPRDICKRLAGIDDSLHAVAAAPANFRDGRGEWRSLTVS